MARKSVKMEAVFKMKMSGKTAKEIAKDTGLEYKTVCGYISKRRQIGFRSKCDICETPIRGKTDVFRGKVLCGNCLVNAESSKCEAIDILRDNPIYHRIESIFDVSCSTPRRIHCGAQ